MYILYNADGSINKINLTDFIQQGNNNVNHIFLGIIGKNHSEWSATAYFELPNGDAELLTAAQANEVIDGVKYYGWSISLSAAVTIYEGEVSFSISIVNLQNDVLNTYNGKLVINPAGIIPDETMISVSQYEALLRYVLSATQNKSEIRNVIFVFDDSSIPESFTRFQDGQVFFNESSSKFYKLVNGSLVEYVIFNPDDKFVTTEDTEYVIPPEDR